MWCILDDISIYYEEIGQGLPIICIHGFEVDHRMMIGCIEPNFTNEDNTKYKRIYIDLPGMGKSGYSPSIKNADDFLDILERIIQNIIPDQNFLLVGESYGGYLSLGLLKKMSQRIESIFLICPVIISENKNRNLPLKNLTLNHDKNFSLSSTEFNEYVEMTVNISRKTWNRYNNEILVGLRSGNKEFLNNFQSHGYSFSFEDNLATLTYDKPATILLGKQDHIVGYKDTLYLLENFKRSSLVILDSSGHNLQIEQEEIFNAHFRSYLNNTALHYERFYLLT